jgi:hypothetical protein
MPAEPGPSLSAKLTAKPQKYFHKRSLQMSEMIDIKIPSTPGVRDVVLTENVFISINSASADVEITTSHALISRNPPPPPRVTNHCEDALTWTFSGSHVTGSKGTVEIHLNKFLDCAAFKYVVVGEADAPVVVKWQDNYIGSMAHFTATPESEEPVFLTTTVNLSPLPPHPGRFFKPDPLDVKVTISSWKHDGKPAANVAFNWIAVARTASYSDI